MPVYSFGPFVLDVGERLLRQGERRIAVSGKTFDVLCLLVEAKGRLVDRETFNSKLWPTVTVEDRNLTVHVSGLRKALNGSSPPIDCIETVSKIGYRLAVPVQLLSPAPRDPHHRASTEARRLEGEARAQLHRAERVPALKALALFERVLGAQGGVTSGPVPSEKGLWSRRR